ncbi:uncharacterized protein LOC103316421 [Nasonia vitripennis]|uniref:Uncharacterized protein n=1 Tax=Nasonia vitripennis TaxID=7425 RepID=A0A7M7HB92_NASVI|nr:uncharacterized protein LOC103316421 [Nasonia vitripennis]
MRFARSPLFQIAYSLLILASCVVAAPKAVTKTKDGVEDDNYSEDEDVPKNHRKQLEDEIDLDDAFDTEQLKNEQLPILPPIILLDFVNGTDDNNSTSSGDEKSKRTIDGSLGYGFNQNSLFSGKHNFYFPAGKTGTAVSIEESISLAPKTVTEIEKPITEETDANSPQNEQEKKTREPLFEALPDPLPLENGREPPPLYPPFPMFGQRTKLQKTSSSDFGQYQSRPGTKQFSSSYATAATPGSETYNKLIAAYTSMKPAAYHTGSSSFSSSANINGYARPMTSSYLTNYMPGAYISSTSQKSSYNSRPMPSVSAGSNQEINFANYPRYTYENGIKYEHKIVWKYPDGKISETPPMSYTNSYSEYSEQQKINTASINGFRPSTPYQPRPGNSQQYQRIQGSSYNPSLANAQNNIYSQRPVQFPKDQEQKNPNQPKEPSRFISHSSGSASPGNRVESASPYNFASYQGQYGMKQSPKSAGYRVASGYNSPYNNQYVNSQSAPKYSVDSPEADYTYESPQGPKENLFSANGQINQQVLSKYSPEAQQYLKKVFDNAKTSAKIEAHNNVPAGYANTDYSNLLNYNPSISQYIKNPSSILNAQPTFIQAGNSLIPVIILRVDGAPPIQPKVGSNINLKSLLRQYLTQYAKSVSNVSQNTNYDLGGSINDGEVSASQPNPVEDLKQLTESLASLRQRGHQDPDFTTSYAHTSTYEQQSQHKHLPQQSQSIIPGQDYSTSYAGFVKDYQKIHAGQQGRKSQKVKSVQIIEDPTYTSYKVDNN